MLGFVLCPSALAAIITGHMARSQVKASGGALTGAGMALAGLIMGYLAALVAPEAILAAIALPAITAAQDRSTVVRCMNNAKQIAIACRTYAADHDGKFPATLDELVPDYVPDRSLFVCPITKDTS